MVNCRDAMGGGCDSPIAPDLRGGRDSLLQYFGATSVSTSRPSAREGLNTQEGETDDFKCLSPTFLTEFFLFPNPRHKASPEIQWEENSEELEARHLLASGKKWKPEVPVLPSSA